MTATTGATNPTRATRTRDVALACAGVGSVLLVVGAVIDPRRTAFAYLVAFAFAFSVAVCALGLLMIGHATGARWFVVLRRLCEAVVVAVPLFVLLFVPIALWMKRLYPWADVSQTWTEPVREAIRRRGAWHSRSFFLARSAFYLVTCSVLALVLRRASVRQDTAGFDPAHRRLVRTIGGGGLPLLGLVLTFAAWDWMMSLDPVWHSNIYGLYVLGGGLAGAFSLLAVLAHAARAHGVVPKEVSAPHFHALGNLMLAMTIFWAWMAFSQLVVLWIADIPSESIFYSVRWTGYWRGVSVLLLLGHFALPFLLLLRRPLKRDGRSLARIGVLLLVMHAVDMHWLLAPIVHPQGWALHWVDAGALLFVVGVVTAFGAWRFAATPPVPVEDPGLADSLRWEMS